MEESRIFEFSCDQNIKLSRSGKLISTEMKTVMLIKIQEGGCKNIFSVLV